MRKSLVVILALLLAVALVFTGCGGASPEDPDDAGPDTNVTDPTDLDVIDPGDQPDTYNYEISLVDKVENISDIYCIDIASDDYEKFDMIAHYKDERTLTVATITGKIDHRMLDLSDGKIYFVIANDDLGTPEVSYIDLNRLGDGPTVLTKFNDMYKSASKFLNGAYPTQIFVHNNLIYYTEFSGSGGPSTLKTYNLITNETKILSSRNISWSDWYLDKTHNKLFYCDDDYNFYVANLDGTHEVQTNDIFADYNGCNLGIFINAIYQNAPLFAVVFDTDDQLALSDLYTFDYSRNVFVKLFADVKEYTMMYNSIVYSKSDSSVIHKFFTVT